MTREEIKDYIAYHRDVEKLTYGEIGDLLNMVENSTKYNRQYVHQVYKRKKEYDRRHRLKDEIKAEAIKLYSRNLNISETVEELRKVYGEEITYSKIYETIRNNGDSVGSLYSDLVSRLAKIVDSDDDISIEKVKELLSYDENYVVTDYSIKELMYDSVKKLLLEYIESLRDKNTELFVGSLDLVVKDFEKKLEKM